MRSTADSATRNYKPLSLMLKGKTIVLGVTGSIAAYKIANLASMLVKLHADVNVIMTRNATNFITPMTFETLTGNKCIVDTFDRNFNFEVEHVSLAKRADMFLIAPATANVIGKIAGGICDDMLTTTVMATKAPVVISPAMNTGMWENPIMQANVEKLKAYGYRFIEPVSGRLACGDTGSGKMPSEETLLQHIELTIGMEKDMEGRRVLVTAGPTCEAIDPVRFITNHSSGRMGYALAKVAAMRGADVTLVTGPVALTPHAGIRTVVNVTSAADMFSAVAEHSLQSDFVIMCSAVADYTPLQYSSQKVKKKDGDLSLQLARTEDILKYLGSHKAEGQKIIGFSMETENLIENSRQKLLKKNCDLICANSINGTDTGFGTTTNRVTLISPTDMRELPLCSKEETADLILSYANTL